MNAAVEIERLLEQHHAVLVRQSKHLVYRLPNGNVFTRSRTPSDFRASRNELSDLRHALGIVGQQSTGERTMEEQRPTASAPAPPAPVLESPTPVAQMVPDSDSLRHRIDVAIARAEQEQEHLLAAAQKAERRVQMLKALVPFSEDASTEAVLRAILKTTPPPPPKPEPVAPPPQVITERVQVTRQLVLAATQTFQDAFTVNDVMALMTGGRAIDGDERLRVRQSISQCMLALLERGELVRESEGIGRKQSTWRKVVLNGHITKASNGHVNGTVGTRA